MSTHKRLVPGLALALGCQPAGAPVQDPAPSSAPASAAAAEEKPRALTGRAEVESAIGQRVVIVGLAREAKLGAVVLVDGAPIYCLGQDRWPEGVEGEQVEVTGTLSRTDRFAARVDDDGAISQGTQGEVTVIEPCSFHLLTVDDVG